MNNLHEKNCESCNTQTPKLLISEINENMEKLDSWTLNENQEMIFKKFKFNNFKKAISLANKIGDIAESEGHHPDISIGYGYCLVMVHTHAIKGLSINDFILAAKIDALNEI